MKEGLRVCSIDDVPRLGARVVKCTLGDNAVFGNADDEVFAPFDKCPHKGRPVVARHRPRQEGGLPAAQLEHPA
jgi:nitrite reductase (NADH) small subunit